jgi:amino acid transporter
VPRAAPQRALSMLDSTSLIVGIIIGAGIYQVAPDVARGVGGWPGVLAIWTLGGVLSLFGALGYAELASAYPREGGDYVYLSRAYGRWAGFMFGWIQTVIVRPGDIVVMAFAFALYARTIWDPLPFGGGLHSEQLYACGAVLVLTAINVAGVRAGKSTQNVLTVVKVLGLLSVVGVGLFAPVQSASPSPTTADGGALPLSLALILVLFSYGGWNEMAYVAAEVRHPERNIIRAMLLGTVSVTLIYLLVNVAFLARLGYEGLIRSEAVAVDVMARVLPEAAERFVAILICISALGAVNGLIFAGSRISYAVGADHRAFRWLGRWERRTQTPMRSLLLQAAIALLLVLSLGSFVNTILYTAASVYLFYLATSVALIVLRRREPDRARPYRVTGYPFTTLIFSAVCAFLIHGAVTYKPLVAGVSVALLLTGVVVYRWSRGGCER